MYPILFVISGRPIYSSAVFLVLAVVVGFFVGRMESRRRGISDREFYVYWLLATPTALVLAALNSALLHGRLINVFTNPNEIISGGLVSFGAVIGTLGLGVIVAKVFQRPVGQFTDAIAIILPLILGVYRIGCILNGCCHGLETDGIFGVYLPNISGHWEDRYPTQFLLLIFDFALFFFLWKWRLKDPANGKITFTFLVSFLIFRLILDGFRELPMVNEWINILQLSSLITLLITIYILIMVQLRKQSSKSDPVD